MQSPYILINSDNSEMKNDIAKFSINHTIYSFGSSRYIVCETNNATPSKRGICMCGNSQEVLMFILASCSYQ